jgi:hypothetical protein
LGETYDGILIQMFFMAGFGSITKNVYAIGNPDQKSPSMECCWRKGKNKKAVLRIFMFLGLPDPGPLIRGTDQTPDPFIIKGKYSKKNLDSHCFVTSL